MNRPTVAFLGPEGTFSHQAALAAVGSSHELQPLSVPTVTEVFRAVSSGEADLGVVAAENTVEGPVFATIDGLLAATDLVATGEIVLPITFDAFALTKTDPYDKCLTQATAHPHGLAQCRKFIVEHGWQEIPADSNGAACRDLEANQVAFGPAISGEIYHLNTLAKGVEDFPGALTRFLIITKRSEAPVLLAAHSRHTAALETHSRHSAALETHSRHSADLGTVSRHSAALGTVSRHSAALETSSCHSAALEEGAQNLPAWRTLLAITPRDTGPGVLSRITKQFARRKLNLSSLISRPLKAQSGKYLFVVTLDAPPWQPESRALLADLLAAGDAIKTLGVWRADPAHDTVGGVLPDSIPPGSVTGIDNAPTLELGLLW